MHLGSLRIWAYKCQSAVVWQEPHITIFFATVHTSMRQLGAKVGENPRSLNTKGSVVRAKILLRPQSILAASRSRMTSPGGKRAVQTPLSLPTYHCLNQTKTGIKSGCTLYIILRLSRNKATASSPRILQHNLFFSGFPRRCLQNVDGRSVRGVTWFLSNGSTWFSFPVSASAEDSPHSGVEVRLKDQVGISGGHHCFGYFQQRRPYWPTWLSTSGRATPACQETRGPIKYISSSSEYEMRSFFFSEHLG